MPAKFHSRGPVIVSQLQVLYSRAESDMLLSAQQFSAGDRKKSCLRTETQLTRCNKKICTIQPLSGLPHLRVPCGGPGVAATGSAYVLAIFKD